MSRLKQTIKKIAMSQWLKYAVVVVVAVVIVGFADENSIYNHFKNREKIAELSDAIEKYRGIYTRDQAQLKRLESDPKAIEKIARERYFMKRADEDVFVLSTDQATAKQEDNETTE